MIFFSEDIKNKFNDFLENFKQQQQNDEKSKLDKIEREKNVNKIILKDSVTSLVILKTNPNQVTIEEKIPIELE